MMNFARLLLYFLATLIKICGPGGIKTIAAENILLRQQLITLCRSQKRSPHLKLCDRFLYGFLTSFINPKRLIKLAIAIKPSTLLRFHKALITKKYQLLYSNKSKKKPGPKGPSKELVHLVLEMKKRNPGCGYLRIALQINNLFGLNIDQHVVKRILDKYFMPSDDNNGPSWLTLLGHAKDSLWSIDLFKAESIALKSHWVMVMMDQFTRRIIGFSVHAGHLNGISLCCLFNQLISNKKLLIYLSSDNDPLFNFHRWQANLRVLDIEEIKTIPHIPKSHPFVED